MPTLSEKLKSLGVKVGAQDLPKPAPRNPYSVENVLQGTYLPTQLGETFMVETRYPAEYRHGRAGLTTDASLRVIGEWAGDPSIAEFDPCSFAYLDTETTGLSGGTGTYAFLIGVGRFEGGEFRLAQFFMRDPVEEASQLAALEEFLAPCSALVTFNGKSFDIPLLATRFITHGWRHPFGATPHVDLLHLARRLWRDRLPKRALIDLEYQILGISRNEEDVPGWLIPSLYFQYLRDGDARPLKNIFYHNALDVVSMAALLSHMAALLDNPLQVELEHQGDLVAIARLFESLGDLDRAASLYVHCLDLDIPETNLLIAMEHLAQIYKHQQNTEAAVNLWEQAAHHHHLNSHLELAKVYEHRRRDYAQALHWTLAALELLNSGQATAYERLHMLPELEHRMRRLEQKLHINGRDSDDIIPPANEP